MAIVIHNHFIDRLAVVTGVISALALLPQVQVIMQATSFEHFSPITFVVIFFNSFVWLTYAIHRQLLTLAIPSIINIFSSGAVVLKIVSLML
ncbi:hypothetical protein JNK62_04695 [bacterium]|nr:hypothetical protein [bacterium]